jgi:hypothetical protein
MQLFSRLPEGQMRVIRWLLLIGWLLLIVSLLLPALHLPAALVPPCPQGLAEPCEVHHQPGNRLFWGTVVPVGLLLIGAISHEIWRRICPLAFVSQLARALGRQRSRPGRKGRSELVMVKPESWLGRHHLTLQWSLLIAGLCLRLLAVNGSPLGLAILLLLTLVAALLVGWAWGGKAWCQYVCPMGPVQTVLTGLRGPLGSTAHVGTSSKISQSMCRTLSAEGHEQSACVACQAPCIDIDSERSFWQTLRGKRGLSWIWFSYPGLILAFFLLMQAVGAGSGLENHSLGYLRSGAWAFDAGQPGRFWQPLWPVPFLPRLLLIPLLLAAAAALSALLFQGLQHLLERLFRRQGLGEPQDRALQRTRLLASFLAINLFFWFVDPFQGALGGEGGELLQLLVLLATSIALYRSWGRDQATYRRESVGEGLRRQLRDLQGLDAALDGRSLDALSPQEVFTLVKAMPAIGRQQGHAIYREVMVEMLRSGRLSTATALLELFELRQSLGLEEADHHAVLRDLAREQPDLLEKDQRERQISDLRHEAGVEAVQELMQVAGVAVLQPDRLPKGLQLGLERVQRELGLEDDAWEELLLGFGARGEQERRRLDSLRTAWTTEAGLGARLAELAPTDPMLQPLRQALTQRSEGLRLELDGRLAAAGLDALPATVAPSGDLEQALDLLWHDPDPDTAGWVLMLAREREPQRAARLLQDPRPGLASSPFLESQRRGQLDPDREDFAAIAASPLFADLLPDDVLWVAREGSLRTHPAHAMVMERGAASDELALVLSGALRVQTAAGQSVELGAGQTVGEMGVITGRPRSAAVQAGPEGARMLVLPARSFEELLQRSRRFDRGLLTQLACRLSAPAMEPSG